MSKVIKDHELALVRRSFAKQILAAVNVINPRIEAACTTSVEQTLRHWPVPALATPVRGSSLEGLLRGNNCQTKPGQSVLEGPLGKTLKRDERKTLLDTYLGITGDGLLYIGPESDLVLTPLMPDYYLDPDYRAELSRRLQIMIGRSLSPTVTNSRYITAVPHKFWQ